MALIVVIQNISSLAPVSDYKYRVMVGDGTRERSKTLAQGTIHDHKRDDGWHKLLAMMLADSKGL